ncbi:hypothetical protein ACFQE1_00040 [Halobium palmae]|uniref:Phage holin family protein n=1 Tax=Halobium palmae TaxID=1776492 RepID=A0ABD5RUF8_9EURY
MALIDNIVVFLVSLLVGTLGIYVGARIIAHVDNFSYAALTALIGALAWFLTGLLVGWIPFLGILITLLVYLAVINWRYPGGWINATGIALVAWIVSFVVLYALAAFNIFAVEALGVPGV